MYSTGIPRGEYSHGDFTVANLTIYDADPRTIPVGTASALNPSDPFSGRKAWMQKLVVLLACLNFSVLSHAEPPKKNFQLVPAVVPGDLPKVVTHIEGQGAQGEEKHHESETIQMKVLAFVMVDREFKNAGTPEGKKALVGVRENRCMASAMDHLLDLADKDPQIQQVLGELTSLGRGTPELVLEIQNERFAKIANICPGYSLSFSFRFSDQLSASARTKLNDKNATISISDPNAPFSKPSVKAMDIEKVQQLALESLIDLQLQGEQRKKDLASIAARESEKKEKEKSVEETIAKDPFYKRLK